MVLELRDCSFFGPALPEPFVKFQLENELNRRKLLPKSTGPEGRALEERWEVLRRKLRALGEQGGDRRVANHVLEPLLERLGYQTFERQAEVITREGAEDGGVLFNTAEGQKLRAWSVSLGTDLDAPSRRGRAYRFSPSRVAQRVLLASGERVGLLTDGEELRLLICDPARPDSHIAIRLDRSGGWRAARTAPDSYRLLLALASPAGVAAVSDLTEAARLAQSAVTKKLRVQARQAIEGFLQELLDHPGNAQIHAEETDTAELAKQLWREGLILVYRLLFVFKLESSADPARAFSFAATSLWRNTYSPNTALAALVRRVIDGGADSGGFLEGGLRTLWRLFAEGMSSSELEIKALGGMLFGSEATPLLDRLSWGERGVARLLDALLWTPGEGNSERERVHYGALDVEDLGRVYESLLELEPGISSEPMCRLRRAKLEVVVPIAQGAPYRSSTATGANEDAETEDDEEDGEPENDEAPAARPTRGAAGSKTKVLFIEEIPAERFFLRVGLGRKASGSYYTPHPFVRFLVLETLGPLLTERSPKEDPHPALILKLKVLDSAMGSGHFLVEACRFLGEALYEACRLCDELAVQAEEQAEKAEGAEREALLAKASELRQRVEDLPDPDNELLAYLPSRAVEGEESGLSQKKAESMCRRLVAVHCLYGVDKNPLAVELAKLSLWLESYAEGLPLTFLDHRLICGDSLTGPFFEHLLTYPKSGGRLDDLFAQGLTDRLQATLANALVHVRDLEASVGKDLADLQQKETAKKKLDDALAPLKTLASAWSGGVMLGDECDDGGYQVLANAVANGEDTKPLLAEREQLAAMVAKGHAGVVFQLGFPEVFAHEEESQRGFDAVFGNPPWDALQPYAKEFYAAFDLRVLDAPTRKERAAVERALTGSPTVASAWEAYAAEFDQAKRITARLTEYVGRQAGGRSSGAISDLWQVFAERASTLTRRNGFIGYVFPSAFHANQSATGLRQLYLERMVLRCCFSFENRKKLFDIHRSFKFAAVVAQNDPAGTSDFECGFYWHDLERLFDGFQRLHYSADFVRRTGGGYYAFQELRDLQDVIASDAIYLNSISMEHCMREYSIRCGEEIHMSKGAHYFATAYTILPDGADPRAPDVARSLRSSGYLPLHEGKTFHQYDDRWESAPRYLVAIKALAEKPGWLRAAEHYRLAFRDIASSTNERTGIFCLLPPGVVCGNTAPCEREPNSRPTGRALLLQAVANSIPFDWTIRLKAAAHVNLFILNGCPFPVLVAQHKPFLAHSALRLTCNHSGYARLWREQLGEAWREPIPTQTWPVLEGDDTRWGVRAAIDAVVADAYGLDRGQYEHVLSTFNHRSYPKAPELCLAAFDELNAIGLEAFTQKHDPYWDIPLNENLPQPVIDLSIPGEVQAAGGSLGPLFDSGPASSSAGLSAGFARPNPPVASMPLVAAPPRVSANGAYSTITQLLQTRGLISSGDAQQATGLDAAGVRPHLQRLVQEGRAVPEGQKRGTKYRSVDA